ncbi:hypothetical protein SFUMM280S_02724 [Streptomyces fumanus]
MQNAVARNAAVKAAVKAVWPAVDPAKLVLRLLTDADFLAEHAAGLLDEEEQKAILWAKPVRGGSSWTGVDKGVPPADLEQRLRGPAGFRPVGGTPCEGGGQERRV